MIEYIIPVSGSDEIVPPIKLLIPCSFSRVSSRSAIDRAGNLFSSSFLVAIHPRPQTSPPSVSMFIIPMADNSPPITTPVGPFKCLYLQPYLGRGKPLERYINLESCPSIILFEKQSKVQGRS